MVVNVSAITGDILVIIDDIIDYHTVLHSYLVYVSIIGFHIPWNTAVKNLLMDVVHVNALAVDCIFYHHLVVIDLTMYVNETIIMTIKITVYVVYMATQRTDDIIISILYYTHLPRERMHTTFDVAFHYIGKINSERIIVIRS